MGTALTEEQAIAAIDAWFRHHYERDLTSAAKRNDSTVWTHSRAGKDLQTHISTVADTTQDGHRIIMMLEERSAQKPISSFSKRHRLTFDVVPTASQEIGLQIHLEPFRFASYAVIRGQGTTEQVVMDQEPVMNLFAWIERCR